jgi:hypothetical protein
MFQYRFSTRKGKKKGGHVAALPNPGCTRGCWAQPFPVQVRMISVEARVPSEKTPVT